MSNNRSYWNIDRGNRPLGVELVSPSGHYFFIHAEKLIALHRYPDEYVRVKYKDQRPDTALYHHPGEIYGRLSTLGRDYCRISLYFGYAGQVVEHDKATDLLMDLHSEQHHIIPASEFSSLAHVLTSMYVHREKFNELKLLSESCRPFK